MCYILDFLPTALNPVFDAEFCAGIHSICIKSQNELAKKPKYKVKLNSSYLVPLW